MPYVVLISVSICRHKTRSIVQMAKCLLHWFLQSPTYVPYYAWFLFCCKPWLFKWVLLKHVIKISWMPVSIHYEVVLLWNESVLFWDRGGVYTKSISRFLVHRKQRVVETRRLISLYLNLAPSHTALSKYWEQKDKTWNDWHIVYENAQASNVETHQDPKIFCIFIFIIIIVTIYVCDSRRCMDWWIDLLTTYRS
jgi:hypothetical protein